MVITNNNIVNNKLLDQLAEQKHDILVFILMGEDNERGETQLNEVQVGAAIDENLKRNVTAHAFFSLEALCVNQFSQINFGTFSQLKFILGMNKSVIFLLVKEGNGVSLYLFTFWSSFLVKFGKFFPKLL